jgi:hypothetical protein
MSAHRFEQIINEMKELANEAQSLIPPHAQPRADYWVAQLAMITDNDHGYMGGVMYSMVDTLEEWDDRDIAEQEAREAEAVMEFFKNNSTSSYGEFTVSCLRSDHLEVTYQGETNYFNLDNIADAIEEIGEQRLPVTTGDSAYYIAILSLLTV